MSLCCSFSIWYKHVPTAKFDALVFSTFSHVELSILRCAVLLRLFFNAWNAFFCFSSQCHLSFLLLAAKYSCWLLLSLSLLEEVYFIQPERQPTSYGPCCSFETLKASCSLVSLRKLAVFWLYCITYLPLEVLKPFRLYLLYDQLYVFLTVFLNILFWV